MNRREFLIAVGAVPVAAYFAGKVVSGELYYEGTHTLVTKVPANLYPWQQRIWDMLQSGKKVMYVTSTQRNAHHIYNVFQRHKNLHATSMQAPLTGRQADLVVMDDFGGNMNEEWYNTCVRTRLTPGGEIEWIHT